MKNSLLLMAWCVIYRQLVVVQYVSVRGSSETSINFPHYVLGLSLLRSGDRW